MSLLPFVIPVLAIVYLCWFLHRPALACIGFSKLKQFTHGDARSTAQLACQRGQSDEYETLLALGFIPLGIYRETNEVFDGTNDQYVFTHQELPVVCSLCENANQELYIVLTTDDREGRFVRTSSSAAKVEFDSRDAFAQTIEAETLEQVFVAHVRALDNWEQAGFQPVRVDTLDAIKAHYLRHYLNPETQHLLRSLYIGLIGASVFASVGIPVALCMATQFLVDRFQVNLGSSVLAQIFATTSLAVTYWVAAAQKSLSKVPAENSLRPRDQSIDATSSNIQEPVIENVKESNSDRFTWTLPSRDSSDTFEVGLHALALSLVPVFVIAVWGTVIVVSVLNAQVHWIASVVVYMITAVLALPIINWAIAYLRGHSYHELKIQNGYLCSTERAYWLRLTRKRLVKKIVELKIDPMTRHPRFAMSIFHNAKHKDWRTLAVCLDDGTEFVVAFAYPEQTLVPLAKQVAAAIGLETNAVRTRQITENPIDSQVAIDEAGIVAEAQDLSQEVRSVFAPSSNPPRAIHRKRFEFTNAAWHKKTKWFSIATTALVAGNIIGMFFAPPAFMLLFFLPSLIQFCKGRTRLRRFLPLKTTLEVGPDHLRCSTGKADRDNAVEFHFENIIEFQMTSRKGVNFLAANLSGEGWQSLVTDLGGFSLTEIESAMQYCQSQLESYQARTNQPIKTSSPA